MVQEIYTWCQGNLTEEKNGGMPKNGSLKDIKISEMRGRYFVITCDTSVFINHPAVYIIDSQCSNLTSKDKVMSGNILLMYCVDDY